MSRVVAFALLTIAVCCCADRVPGPADGYLLSGTVTDAETGEPVSRQVLNLHFFCDEIDFQVSLAPAPGPEFAVRVPKRTVRIRAGNSEGAYHLFEETITIEGDSAVRTIRLVPTHYVRLYGKFTDLTTGRPARANRGSGIGDTPMLAFVAAEGPRGGRLRYRPDGTYSVRVPRTKLKVRTLDTPYAPKVRELDLTGFEEDELEFDVEIE
jgi:hypothetical protein